eukprot:PITA_24891
MLLLRSYPNSLFMGSVFSHSESIKGSVRTELDPPIWNLERSVYRISRYANSNPHPHLMDGLNGAPLFCTSSGQTVAYVSESNYITRGPGIRTRGGDCEADDDQNSKSSRHVHYQTLLEANPGNPLLLSNYAKFLHEVQHDMEKAEEYYKMAILASPGDAEVVSLYANFIWETHKDTARAQATFDEALNLASSDDCYVLASYAHFLWNSEEEDEDQKDGPAGLQIVSTKTYVRSVSSAA